jgi:hypothetical protein
VLAGHAGRDIRWFLRTARTGFSHGVEIHLSKSGLHAFASLSIDRSYLSLQPGVIFIPGRCTPCAGRFSRALRGSGKAPNAWWALTTVLRLVTGLSRRHKHCLTRCLLLAFPQQDPPAYQHGCAPKQKAEIPPDPLLVGHRLVDMMDTKELVVDETFCQVEDPKAHQYRAGEQLTRPAHVHSVSGAPQNDETKYDEYVSARMKEAVPERIDFKILHVVRRVSGAGNHVVPLKQLVQNDAIEEAAQTQAEQNSS